VVKLAVAQNPHAVRIWIKAADLEVEQRAKRRVFRKVMDHNKGIVPGTYLCNALTQFLRNEKVLLKINTAYFVHLPNKFNFITGSVHLEQDLKDLALTGIRIRSEVLCPRLVRM
jgi:hypothetical protein